MEQTTIQQEVKKFYPVSPAFKSELYSIWLNLDKKGRPYATVKRNGEEKAVNVFKFHPKREA